MLKIKTITEFDTFVEFLKILYFDQKGKTPDPFEYVII